MYDIYGAGYSSKRDFEAQYSNADYKLLDTFEAGRLSKADAIFAKGEYKAAFPEYDSFILEFPKSKALAYALLRKARCLHMDNKRYEAIKAYNEVLDYFPNAVYYAGPALYYMGRANFQNGDVEKAMKAWMELADDPDYSKHPLAADAINELADQLVKQNSPDQAEKYYEQVALTFRTQNQTAASYAIGKVIEHYVHRKPDETKLRAFYVAARGFAPAPAKIPADLSEDHEYWGRVTEAVQRLDDFPPDQAGLKANYFHYWAGMLSGRLADWDDYQIIVAEIKLADDKDLQLWKDRLDAQFTKYQKPNDYARLIKWMHLYNNYKDKALEYFNKSDYTKWDVKTAIAMTQACYAIFKPEMGRNTFNKINLDKLTDPEKVNLARYFWGVDQPLVPKICGLITNKDLGNVELMRFYSWRGNATDGLPLCDVVAKIAEYSQEAICAKAGLFEVSQQWAKAISQYQQCDNSPYNLWKIAECYMQLHQPEQAVNQLREIENFFKDSSAEAALRIAWVYKRVDRRNEYIAALHGVLNKYPKSPQSTTAHIELEQLGVRIGGGVNAGE